MNNIDQNERRKSSESVVEPRVGILWLVTGLTPLGDKFVSLLFAHRKRNGDLMRLAAQSKSC